MAVLKSTALTSTYEMTEAKPEQLSSQFVYCGLVGQYRICFVVVLRGEFDDAGVKRVNYCIAGVKFYSIAINAHNKLLILYFVAPSKDSVLICKSFLAEYALKKKISVNFFFKGT